jgi:serine/threonine protein kinase
MLKTLNHDNIIKYIDSFDENDKTYIIMEYMNGGTLADYLSSNSLSNSQICKFTKQIFQGLFYLHSKYIVHRDMKLENILVSHVNGKVQLKISDLGLASYLNFNEYSFEFCGTLKYISPEMIKNSYNHLTDLWSLGIILYYMIFKRYPFRGNNEKEILAAIEKRDYMNCSNGLDKRLKSMLELCLEINPFDRLKIIKLFENIDY